MRRLLLFLLLGFCCCAVAQARTEKLYAYENVIPGGYNFFVRPPADTIGKGKLPVVIFLHGKSLTGTNLNSVLRYGCLDAIQRGVNIDAIVIAPQTSVPSWDASKVNDVLEYVLARYNCDTNRIYVVGMSMGGWGTLKVVEAYPKKIAAALAMCGGYTEPSINGLLQVPLWIIHGSRDELTPCSYSMNLVNKMMASGKADRVIFDMPPCNHSLLARVFYLDDLYGWLFSHNLADPKRYANRNYSMPLDKITNAYSMIKGEPVTFTIEKVKQPGK